MGHRDGHHVLVDDGKKDTVCRKTMCYKFTLFIIAVVLISLIISCVIIVVLRGHLIEADKVTVKVGNLELRVKRDYHEIMMKYFNKVDEDKNGTISLDAALAYFDLLTDGKEVLTAEVFVEALGPEFEFIFEAEDFDDDGEITGTDVPSIHQRVDMDDDEVVSRDEFALYHDLVRRARHEPEAL